VRWDTDRQFPKRSHFRSRCLQVLIVLWRLQEGSYTKVGVDRSQGAGQSQRRWWGISWRFDPLLRHHIVRWDTGHGEGFAPPRGSTVGVRVSAVVRGVPLRSILSIRKPESKCEASWACRRRTDADVWHYYRSTTA
jgi:hypothetical protein